MFNVLIAMDSFKGAVTSKQAGMAVARGIADFTDVNVQVVGVADGGEGSLDAIYQMAGGTFCSALCHDAFHRLKEVNYLIIDGENGRQAFVESADIIGIHDIIPDETTVIKTSSFGLGELIAEIIAAEAEEIIIFLGGTITTDAGLGMMQALGLELYDCQGELVRSDINPLLTVQWFDENQLAEIKQRLARVKITVAGDVTNPFYGKDGAAHMFAPQKGATIEQVAFLDQQLALVAKLVSDIDIQTIPGSGAAGGIAGMLFALGGQSMSGFELICREIKLEDYIKAADFIFTGEGALDTQSMHGKLPFQIARLGQKYNVPVVVLCGKVMTDAGIQDDIFTGTFSIQSAPVSFAEAIAATEQNLEVTSRNVLKTFLAGSWMQPDNK